mmetsp:Transcript_13075/g.19572  ORF Transcript_13075/g.19572 Transcript_13075/m.19572 type:complete len:282 (+) Transcript_13075:359-1204(+)
MLVEIRKSSDSFNHVDAVVHYCYCRRSKSRLYPLEVIKVHEYFFTNILGKNGDRRTSWNNSLEIIPTSNNTPRMFFDQIFQRNTHFFFNSDWIVHISRDSKKFCSRVSFSSHTSKPVSTPSENCRCNCNCFDVSHRGRASIQSHIRWKWRFEPRLSSVAFKTFNKASLFSTNICACSSSHKNVERNSRSACILSEETLFVCFSNCFLHCHCFCPKFSADINISSACAHCSSSDDTSLYKFVRFVPHDFSVLASTWFGFISIDDKVVRSSIRGLWHKRPLQP